MPLGFYGLHMGQRMLSSPFVSEQGKGKDKVREADFEAAFEQAASLLAPAQTDTSETADTGNTVEELANSLADTKLEATAEKESDVEASVEPSSVPCFPMARWLKS
jgi:peroxin-5